MAGFDLQRAAFSCQWRGRGLAGVAGLQMITEFRSFSGRREKSDGTQRNEWTSMALVSPLQKLTCPHCFERFHLAKAPHRLLGRGVPTEPDLAIAKHFGIPARPLNKVDYSPTEGSFWKRLG